MIEVQSHYNDVFYLFWIFFSSSPQEIYQHQEKILQTLRSLEQRVSTLNSKTETHSQSKHFAFQKIDFSQSQFQTDREEALRKRQEDIISRVADLQRRHDALTGSSTFEFLKQIENIFFFVLVTKVPHLQMTMELRLKLVKKPSSEI